MTRRETQAKHEMIRSLVLLYGPREAARQLGLSAGTVTELAARKGWRMATSSTEPPIHTSSATTSPTTSAGSTSSANGPSTQVDQPSNASRNPVSVSDALATALRSHKQRSTAALGQFVAEAAEEALTAKQRLPMAKRVRDVAAIHTSLWPVEAKPQLLSVGILIGQIPVPDSQPEPERRIIPGTSPEPLTLLADVQLGPDPDGQTATELEDREASGAPEEKHS